MDSITLVEALKIEIKTEKQLAISRIQEIVNSQYPWSERLPLNDAITTIADCDKKLETIDKYIKIEQEHTKEE